MKREDLNEVFEWLDSNFDKNNQLEFRTQIRTIDCYYKGCKIFNIRVEDILNIIRDSKEDDDEYDYEESEEF